MNSLSDILSLAVWDHNSNRKDSELGVANFELARLKEDAEQEGLTVNILKEGKERGELRFDAYVAGSSTNHRLTSSRKLTWSARLPRSKFYPVLKPQKLADGTLDAVPETRSSLAPALLAQSNVADLVTFSQAPVSVV